MNILFKSAAWRPRTHLLWWIAAGVWVLAVALRLAGQDRSDRPRVSGHMDSESGDAIVSIDSSGSCNVRLPMESRIIAGHFLRIGQEGSSALPAMKWKLHGAGIFRVPRRALQAFGFVESAGAWLGHVGQLLATPADPSRFFLIDGAHTLRVGRIVAVDASAADIVRRLPDGDFEASPEEEPVLVSSDLAVLAMSIGSMAEHPMSNLIVVPCVRLDGATEHLTSAVEYLHRRILMYDASRKAVVRGATDVLASVEGVVAALRDENPAIDDLLLESVRHLAQRQMSFDEVKRKHLHEYGERDNWLLTRVIGPAWYVHGGDVLNEDGLSAALDQFWARIQALMKRRPGLRARQADAREGTEDMILVGRYNGVIDDCGCKGVDTGGLARLVEYCSSLPSVVVICAGDMFANIGSLRSDAESASTQASLIALLHARSQMLWNLGAADMVAMAMSPSLKSSLHGVLAGSCVTVNIRDRSSGFPVGRSRVVEAGGREFEVFGIAGTEHPENGRRERAIVASCWEVVDPAAALADALQRSEDGVSRRSREVVLVAADVDLDVLARCMDVAGERLSVVLTSGAGDPAMVDGHLRARPAFTTLGSVPVVAHVLSSKGMTCINRRDRRDWEARLQLVGTTVSDTSVINVIQNGVEGRTARDLLVAQGFGQASDVGFVGSESCLACHVLQHEQWSGTPHARSMATLVERQRHHHRSCVACHVTGDGVGGFLSRAGDIGGLGRAFEHVGCESCHGPGGRHVTDAFGVRMHMPTIATCRVCHTAEHSHMDVSNAEHYWMKVRHK
jgi:hypothetical protein